MILEDVVVFRFDDENKIKEKIQANSAKLYPDYWLLNKISITNKFGEISSKDYFQIYTTVTSSQIREGFSAPETISLWNLYSFIRMFEKAGFSTDKHRLHLYKLFFFHFIIRNGYFGN